MLIYNIGETGGVQALINSVTLILYLVENYDVVRKERILVWQSYLSYLKLLWNYFQNKYDSALGGVVTQEVKWWTTI